MIPSQQPHGLSWKQSADYILLFFHPTLLIKTAQELIQGESVEVEGQDAIANSLIHSLALTMRSVFHSEKLIDHLYIDSLVNVLVMHLLKAYAGCQFTPPIGQTGTSNIWA